MARPDGRSDDWAFGYGSDDTAAGVMGEIGAVVMGNRNFDADIHAGGLPYGGQVKVPQFVVTHTARPPLTAGSLAFTFVRGGVEPAVVQARAAAGDKLVALLGGQTNKLERVEIVSTPQITSMRFRAVK